MAKIYRYISVSGISGEGGGTWFIYIFCLVSIKMEKVQEHDIY